MSHKISHADRVLETAQSASAAAKSRVAASWHRSAVKHGLNPDERRAPDRIEQSSLHHRRLALEKLLSVAAPRLDALFSLVGQSGCAVFLTDVDGVILDQRLSAADGPAFEEWGLGTGANWSEEREGTNGIGTCLAEQRHVIIHQDEHFYTRNIGMSCIDAPIYGADGQIVGALDLSSARADQTEAFNRLIAAQVTQTARAIEAANFRAAYTSARIVVAESDDVEAATLLAINDNDLVIGATREARRVFGMSRTGALVARPAADILGREDGPTGFEKAEKAAVIRALARAGNNVSEAARQLGIGRATLYRRMKRLGLDGN
ncbi:MULTISPECIES: GAF domain-containing protein [Roseobacteraceae]|jgi:transcriptional regulator of acetoin/glycerol metabolism|uniref:Acetoin catabolism regulatory protein n=1 Tax=Pseudosulfitobacter pseudonitzschiae TaxID=1402135 RepID=A0A221K478_9RHOB|nr:MULTISPECIES: GAF domain-containing protein [Roseobacteraceae]ASM73673.1 acetoin catabolism regulatory protein [Pseudosulfitobacter pseudonitzschiae]